MIVRRTQARMREQDRIFRQREKLVEGRVGRMARVDDDAEPVHFGDPLPAERTEAVPFRLVGRAVGELVVQPVHRAREPHATLVEFLEQRQIEPERVRSEEHTSELQSLMRISYAVFCLKKKKKKK